MPLLRFPPYTVKVGVRACRVQVCNAHQVNTWCARDLGKVHAAEFARADQADPDGVVVSCPLLKLGVKTHAASFSGCFIAC